MSYRVLTLPELVDLSLKTPEAGAVNFNTLRIVLLKIIDELNFNHVTAEYRPPVDIKALVTGVLEDKNLPDHPLLRKIARAKVVEEKESPDFENVVEIASSQEETGTEKLGFSSTRDNEFDGTPQISDVVDTEERTSEFSEGESSALEPAEVSTTSKGKETATNLWQLFQIKKLVKRVESFEEQLGSLIETVDELVEFKEARTKRILFEEGQKLESGYSGALIGRQEFEDTVDELGEALARIAMKLRQQHDDCMAVSRDILKEICLKVPSEDFEDNKEDVNRKIKILGQAVKYIQTVIKDSLNPEACAVTKCVACKRKAHLPTRFMNVNTRENIDNAKYDNASSSDGSSSRLGAAKEQDLPFTTAMLKRYETQENVDKQTDTKTSLDKIPVKLERQTERSEHPEHFRNIKTFGDINAIARDFEAMKQRSVFVPKSRPKQAPAAILLENEEAMDSFINRFSKR